MFWLLKYSTVLSGACMSKGTRFMHGNNVWRDGCRQTVQFKRDTTDTELILAHVGAECQVTGTVLYSAAEYDIAHIATCYLEHGQGTCSVDNRI